MSYQIETTYKVQLENRNRSTVFFRLILIAPVGIFVASFGGFNNNGDNYFLASYTSGLFVIPVVLALLFRGVYPSYALSLNKSLLGLFNRITAYVTLLTDEYPSIEESDVVAITYPEINGGKSLSQGLPLVKWFLAIPLYILGCLYSIYALVLVILGWFSILSSGTFPQASAEGIVKVSQYWNRIYGYAVLLVTDEYPSINL